MRLAERRQEVTSPTVAAPAHCVVDEDAGAPESHVRFLQLQHETGNYSLIFPAPGAQTLRS